MSTDHQLKKEELGVRKAEYGWSRVTAIIGFLIVVVQSYVAFQVGQIEREMKQTQIDISQTQTRIAQTQADIAQTRIDISAIELMLEYMPSLHNSNAAIRKHSIETLQLAAAHFSVGENATSLLNKLVQPYVKQLEAETVSETGAVAPVTLQYNESVIATRNVERWFAVAHSYQIQNLDRAKTAACDAISKIAAAGNWPSDLPRKVEIYETKISRHNAVTIGGAMDRAQAVAAAQRTRDLGISSSAFAQVDRQWKRVVSETQLTVHCGGAQ